MPRKPPQQRPHKSKQDYATPWGLVQATSKLVGAPFVLDLAASAENAKAPYYINAEQDSLARPWAELLAGGWGWLNPPWGDIGPWAAKCRDEKDLGAQIAFHVPASVGANWYRDGVHKHSLVMALNGRVAYVGMDQPYPKDCIIALYSPHIAPGFEVWSWQ